MEQQLRNMGQIPQTGPSYLPSLADMKCGPNVVLSGLPTEPPRDRSYTTDSYAGDLNIAPEFTSSRSDEMDSLELRIRTSSMGEGAAETRDMPANKVCDRRFIFSVPFKRYFTYPTFRHSDQRLH